MRVGAIIQARMGSRRLPGKVLADVAGRPLLDHVLERAALVSHPMKLVVATTEAEADDCIATHCKSLGISCFRGSEHDVLSRYLACAAAFDFAHIVRLTADNPFTDVDELNRLVTLHLTGKYDYSHSFGMLPIGVGAEIFTARSLQLSARDGLEPNHREHVNEYIQENPGLFRIGVLDVPNEKRAPNLRLTVDTVQDYERARRLARVASGKRLTTQEAIEHCSHCV